MPFKSIFVRNFHSKAFITHFITLHKQAARHCLVAINQNRSEPNMESSLSPSLSAVEMENDKTLKLKCGKSPVIHSRRAIQPASLPLDQRYSTKLCSPQRSPFISYQAWHNHFITTRSLKITIYAIPLPAPELR